MLGKKGEQIEQLQRQNSLLEAEVEKMRSIYGGIEPFIPFAQELKERVERRYEEVDSQELDQAFDTIYKAMEDDQVIAHLEQRLSTLPIDQLLGMFALRFGEESVLEPLKSITNKALKVHKKEERKNLIAEQAVESHYFDLNHVINGEIIEIVLGDREYGQDSDRDENRIVRLRKDSDEGLYMALYDGPDDAEELRFFEYDTPSIRTNSMVRIGTKIHQSDCKSKLDNKLNFFTPLSIESSENQAYTTDYVIVEVSLGKQIVLDSLRCKIY